ncbi:LiaF domain-containing protein [Ornithinimicrobium sp. W1665]|uniref:LiaF domain-containing protein n=1 Tax=Ornithinimicrobium sp. W1665 TaxID=3416666 RepID=UPI003D6BF455
MQTLPCRGRGSTPRCGPPPLPGPQTPGAGMPEVVPGAPGSWQGGGAAYPSGPGNLPARRDRDQPMVSAFGDLVRTGSWDAARKTVAYQVFGDSKLDLRQVLRPGETLEVELYSLFGSAKILVPEGTDVQIQGMTLLGDARAEVGAAATGTTPPSGGRLVVTGWSVFGDVRVRSVAAGEKLPRGWRWAQPKRS